MAMATGSDKMYVRHPPPTLLSVLVFGLVSACVQLALADAATQTCGENGFLCQNRLECIASAWVCDGEADCSDHSDEDDCQGRTLCASPNATFESSDEDYSSAYRVSKAGVSMGAWYRSKASSRSSSYSYPTQDNTLTKFCWSSWANYDSPSTAPGDWELISKIMRHVYSFCDSPVGIECQTTAGISAKDSGDVGVTCDTKTGLMCNNTLQSNSRCHDYRIRVKCSCGYFMATRAYSYGRRSSGVNQTGLSAVASPMYTLRGFSAVSCTASFAYYLKTRCVQCHNSLSLYQEVLNRGTMKNTSTWLWSASAHANVQPRWQQVSVPLVHVQLNETMRFKFVFSVTPLTNFTFTTYDIAAFDDFDVGQCCGSRRKCGTSEEKCGDGKCVPLSKFCDGTNDCGYDAADEALCVGSKSYGNLTLGCKPVRQHYVCRSSDLRCISPKSLCDGSEDCPDSSDELASVCGQPCEYDCDFSSSLCGLTQDQTGSTTWHLSYTYYSPTQAPGPSLKNVTDVPSGRYAQLNRYWSGGYSGQSARLYTGFFEPANATAPLRVSFWFSMSTGSSLELRIQKGSHLTEQPVSGALPVTVTKNIYLRRNSWRHRVYEVVSPVQFRLVFVGSIGSLYSSFVSLDNLEFSRECATTNVTIPPSNSSCDFEECQSCCWTNVQSDNLDWLRGQGYTKSQGTGPSADHSLGTFDGHYLFVEASGQFNLSRTSYYSCCTATLQSNSFHVPSSYGKCSISFWYHMWGASQGVLTISAQSSGSLYNYYWRTYRSHYVSGNQGNMWHNVTMDLAYIYSYYYRPYGRVQIQFQTGSGHDSDVAIDDISFSGCTFWGPSSCGNQGLCGTVTNTSGYHEQPVPPLNGNCTFEEDLCRWNNSLYGDLQWSPYNLKSQSSGNYAGLARTDGSFLLFPPKQSYYSVYSGRYSILESPVVVPGPACSMTFWYRGISSLYYLSHNGRQAFMPQLAVTMFTSSGTPQTLWNNSNAAVDSWLKVPISIPMVSAFRVHFVATYRQLSYSNSEHIAIDDITFSPTCSFQASSVPYYGQGALSDGCADGTRDGLFHSPNITICRAYWSGSKSMRMARSVRTRVCGNQKSAGRVSCTSPADACAAGWHVCGATGHIEEILSKIGPKDCSSAGYGHASAAINHCHPSFACQQPNTSLDYDCSYFETPCDEPLCCGYDCTAQDSCAGGVWPGKTFYHKEVLLNDGCSYLDASDAGGVMCCRDTGAPPNLPAPKPKTDTAGLVCDFDDSLCGWTNTEGSSLQWTQLNASSLSYNTSELGSHFAGVISTGNQVRTKVEAFLSSPPLSADNKTCGLLFDYILLKTSYYWTPTFKVILQSPTDIRVLLSLNSQRTYFGFSSQTAWRKQSVQFSPPQNGTFHLVLQFEVQSSTRMFFGSFITKSVGIDNLFFVKCTSPSTATCPTSSTATVALQTTLPTTSSPTPTTAQQTTTPTTNSPTPQTTANNPTTGPATPCPSMPTKLSPSSSMSSATTQLPGTASSSPTSGASSVGGNPQPSSSNGNSAAVGALVALLVICVVIIAILLIYVQRLRKTGKLANSQSVRLSAFYKEDPGDVDAQSAPLSGYGNPSEQQLGDDLDEDGVPDTALLLG